MSVSYSGIQRILLAQAIIEKVQGMYDEQIITESVYNDFNEFSDSESSVTKMLPNFDKYVDKIDNYLDLSEKLIDDPKISDEDVAFYLLDKKTKLPGKYQSRQHIGIRPEFGSPEDAADDCLCEFLDSIDGEDVETACYVKITGHYNEDSTEIIKRVKALLGDSASGLKPVVYERPESEVNVFLVKKLSTKKAFKLHSKIESIIKESFAPTNKIQVTLEIP